MSQKINKSVSTISGYESDAHSILSDVLISLAAVYNVSLDDLVGLKNLTAFQFKDLMCFKRTFYMLYEMNF